MNAPINHPRQAALLGQDARFQRYVATQMRITCLGMERVTEPEAIIFIREKCRIKSRRELATNPDALERFRVLRIEFDAWTGKIGRP